MAREPDRNGQPCLPSSLTAIGVSASPRERTSGTSIGTEFLVLASIWCFGVVGCLLGTVHPSASGAGAGHQLVDLARLGTTFAAVVVFVIGPGLAWRAVRPGALQLLGFLPLVGMGVLLVTGSVAWGVGLAGWRHPRIVATIILAPVLVAILACLWRARDRDLLDRNERWALLVVGGAIGLAIGRSLWSPNATGGLYGGQISRTLEVSDRPDSRIPYEVATLVTNIAHPYGPIATGLFSPYTFSARGPFAGLASAPIILLSGGRPPATIATLTTPWTPFDAQGFMSYRLAMMTFAGTSFVSLWTLTRRLAGTAAARFALLLCATTPFLVHEIWFTWPKLLAASFALLSAVCLLDRRPVRAGLSVGLGYLCHPLALVSLPALGLGTLWPVVHPRWRRPQVRSLILFAVGCGVVLLAWRVANGSHYSSGGFLTYIKEDGFSNTLHAYPVTVGAWIADRAISIANTFLPGGLFVFHADPVEINAVTLCYPFCRHAASPGIIHLFYEYWTSVPFGLGILFYPLLILSTWRSLRTWTWPTTVFIGVAFLAFAIYWGASATGMLREGLHAWVLSLLVMVGAEQAAHGFPYLRALSTRLILLSRVVEVLLVAMLPTIVTSHVLISSQYVITDVVALAMMLSAAFLLGRAIWREGAVLAHPANGRASRADPTRAPGPASARAT